MGQKRIEKLGSPVEGFNKLTPAEQDAIVRQQNSDQRTEEQRQESEQRIKTMQENWVNKVNKR